ncbi:unnamed protein product [Caenorhabditis sp. 36 PRJEB53466]|nr:unnamed protein product [Caenorhabditis sp. 36 PRJEB53466]
MSGLVSTEIRRFARQKDSLVIEGISGESDERIDRKCRKSIDSAKTMVGWSCLPQEMHIEVIQFCDLESRLRLRQCSKYWKFVVDATACHIPRVRFHARNGTYKILIFTGIEQKIKLEFDQIDIETVKCRRTRELKNVSDTREFTISHPNHGVLATRTIKNIVATARQCVGGFEVYLGRMTIGQLERIDKALGGWEFRARLLRTDPDVRTGLPFLLRCQRAHLEELQKFSISPENDYTPYELAEADARNVELLQNGDDLRKRMFISYVPAIKYTTLDGKSPAENTIFSIGYQYETKLSEHLDPMVFLNTFEKPIIEIAPNVHLMHFEHETHLCCYTLSPCGLLLRTNADYCTDFMVYEKPENTCDFRWTCEKCADPFEYWYNVKRNKESDWFISEEHLKFETIFPTVNGRNPLQNEFAIWEARWSNMEKVFRYGPSVLWESEEDKALERRRRQALKMKAEEEGVERIEVIRRQAPDSQDEYFEIRANNWSDKIVLSEPTHSKFPYYFKCFLAFSLALLVADLVFVVLPTLEENEEI